MMDETAALELVGLEAIKFSPAHDRVQSGRLLDTETCSAAVLLLCACAVPTQSLTYETWLGKLATSLAVLGRPIGLTDGPDRVSPSHFAKRPSNSREIEPAVHPPLIEAFAKKASNFEKIVPAIPSFTWAG
jgi:hypothetical protein